MRMDRLSEEGQGTDEPLCTLESSPEPHRREAFHMSASWCVILLFLFFFSLSVRC